MIYWLSWPAYEQIRLNALIAEILAKMGRHNEPVKISITELQSDIKSEIIDRDDEPEPEFVTCPSCFRELPLVDGIIISHRRSANGHGAWCLNNHSLEEA
jgi:hypothetical protein